MSFKDAMKITLQVILKRIISNIFIKEIIIVLTVKIFILREQEIALLTIKHMLMLFMKFKNVKIIQIQILYAKVMNKLIIGLLEKMEDLFYYKIKLTLLTIIHIMSDKMKNIWDHFP